MHDRERPGTLYRESHERIDAFVRARPEIDEWPVPATPGWRVHDLVAHLAGEASDYLAGWRPTGRPTDEWTATHVERGRDVPLLDLVDQWAEVSPGVERIVDLETEWILPIDAGSHEYDLRGALGNRDERDNRLVRIIVPGLLATLEVPRPLVITTEYAETVHGMSGDHVPRGERPVRLRTSAFEAFRWRMGRRSRAQLAAMDWSGDPEPYLDRLCIFGPADADLVE